MIHGAGIVTNMCQHVPLKLDTCGYICPTNAACGACHQQIMRGKGQHRLSSQVWELPWINWTISPKEQKKPGNKETASLGFEALLWLPILDLAIVGFTQGWPHGQLPGHTLGLSIWSSLACTAARFRASWGDASNRNRCVKSSGNRLMEPVLPMRPVSSAPLSSKLSERVPVLPLVFNGTSARDYQKQIHTHQASWNNIVCYLTLFMLPGTNRNQWNGPCSPTLKNRRYVQKSTPRLRLYCWWLHSKAKPKIIKTNSPNATACKQIYMRWDPPICYETILLTQQTSHHGLARIIIGYVGCCNYIPICSPKLNSSHVSEWTCGT